MVHASSTRNGIPHSTPFDWLSKGLFFGKQHNGHNDECNEHIASCRDVVSLLQGIDENLAELLHQPEGESSFMTIRLHRLRSLLYEERKQQSEDSSARPSAAFATATVQALTTTSKRQSRLDHLMVKLLQNMCQLPFESRKHVAAIFNYFLVCGVNGSEEGYELNEAEQQQLQQFYQVMVKFRDFVADHFDEIMTLLVQGYDCGVSHPQHPSQPDVALHSGTMFRSCMKHESLYQLLVCNDERVERYVLPFLDVFVHLPNFEVSSDALESLRLVLTPEALSATTYPQPTSPDHDDAAAEKMAQLALGFLGRYYETILEDRLTRKLLSDSASYTTRRVTLEILSTLLLSRSNFSIMIRYVSDRSHLISCMHWLRDTSPHITLEAFQVFKIFVANPNKPPDIVKILKDNQVKLCRYLETLHPDRAANDEQYRDEKELIIQTIEAL